MPADFCESAAYREDIGYTDYRAAVESLYGRGR
jgi:hypothetical protein